MRTDNILRNYNRLLETDEALIRAKIREIEAKLAELSQKVKLQLGLVCPNCYKSTLNKDKNNLQWCDDCCYSNNEKFNQYLRNLE